MISPPRASQCSLRAPACVILCAILVLNSVQGESEANNQLRPLRRDVVRLGHLLQPIISAFSPARFLTSTRPIITKNVQRSSSRQPRFGTITIGLNEPPTYTVTSQQLAETLRIIVWAGVVSHMMLVFMLPVITVTWKNVFCQYVIVDCKDNFGIPLYKPDFLKAFVIDSKKTEELNLKNSVKKRRRRSNGFYSENVMEVDETAGQNSTSSVMNHRDAVESLHLVDIKTTEPSALEAYIQEIFRFLDIVRSAIHPSWF